MSENTDVFLIKGLKLRREIMLTIFKEKKGYKALGDALHRVNLH